MSLLFALSDRDRVFCPFVGRFVRGGFGALLELRLMIFDRVFPDRTQRGSEGGENERGNAEV